MPYSMASVTITSRLCSRIAARPAASQRRRIDVRFTSSISTTMVKAMNTRDAVGVWSHARMPESSSVERKPTYSTVHSLAAAGSASVAGASAAPSPLSRSRTSTTSSWSPGRTAA